MTSKDSSPALRNSSFYETCENVASGRTHLTSHPHLFGFVCFQVHRLSQDFLKTADKVAHKLLQRFACSEFRGDGSTCRSKIILQGLELTLTSVIAT